MILNRIPLVCSRCVLGRRSRNPFGKRSRNPPNPSRFPLPARPSPFPSPPAGHPSTSTRTSLLLPHFQIPANLLPHVLYLLPPPLAISLQPPHLRVEGNHPPASSSTRRAPIPPAGLLDSTPHLPSPFPPLKTFRSSSPRPQHAAATFGHLLRCPRKRNSRRSPGRSPFFHPPASLAPSAQPAALSFDGRHIGFPSSFSTSPHVAPATPEALLRSGQPAIQNCANRSILSNRFDRFASDRADVTPLRSSKHPLHPCCLLSHLACWTTLWNISNPAASPELPWCQNRRGVPAIYFDSYSY